MRHSCVGDPLTLESTSIWTVNQQGVSGVNTVTPAVAEQSRAPRDWGQRQRCSPLRASWASRTRSPGPLGPWT